VRAEQAEAQALYQRGRFGRGGRPAAGL